MIAQLVPMLEFLHPGRLWWLLLAVGLGVLYWILNSLHPSPTSSKRTRLSLVLPKDSALKRHLAVLSSLLAVASLVVAWATPLGVKQVPRERATVVLAIDISRSMRAQDVQPSRIEAAQSAAKDFLDVLPASFNVSLVLFAGDVTTQTVPTTDRATIKTAIDQIQLAPATAIGEAIYSSLDAMKYAPPDPKHPNEPAPGAVVLLSDGYSNVGRPSSDAAQAAKDQKIPVYTIAYGTAGGYVVEDGRRVPVPVNHQELAQIAAISGGKKYAAESGTDLRNVYETLARSLGYDEEKVEITDQYALYAMLFGLLASAGVISLAARWP